MLRKILVTALMSGFLAGIAISVLQEFTTTPIILHAEEYENTGDGKAHSHSTGRAGFVLAHATEQATDGAEAWGPEDGLERSFFTMLANVLTATGFALILVACLALAGRPTDGRTGLMWGMAGFAVFTLAPALGLPPEVPSAMAAELAGRQVWWFLAVAGTALGLWVLVFRSGAIWMVAGIALLALPHVIGAPHPERIGGAVPPELAGHFAAASIVTAAVFWCILGWLSGTLWKKLQTA